MRKDGEFSPICASRVKVCGANQSPKHYAHTYGRLFAADTFGATPFYIFTCVYCGEEILKRVAEFMTRRIPIITHQTIPSWTMSTSRPAPTSHFQIDPNGTIREVYNGQ